MEKKKEKNNSVGTIIGMIIGSIIKFFMDIGYGMGKMLLNHIDKIGKEPTKRKKKKNGRKKRK